MIVQVLKKYWVSNDIGFPEQGLNELSENKSNNIINQKKKLWRILSDLRGKPKV